MPSSRSTTNVYGFAFTVSLDDETNLLKIYRVLIFFQLRISALICDASATSCVTTKRDVRRVLLPLALLSRLRFLVKNFRPRRKVAVAQLSSGGRKRRGINCATVSRDYVQNAAQRGERERETRNNIIVNADKSRRYYITAISIPSCGARARIVLR